MPANAVAAATLALTMLGAVIGTIVQADCSATACGTPPRLEQASAQGVVPEGWEGSLRQTLLQTQRGFQEMAGLAAPR